MSYKWALLNMLFAKCNYVYLDNNAHSSFHQSETVIGIGIRMNKKFDNLHGLISHISYIHNVDFSDIH